MQLTSDNGPQAGDSMYRLNVDAEIWGDVPKLADQCGLVTRVRRNEPPVIDGDPVRRGYFVPVERVVEPRDDRPRPRVGGRFAGEVSGVEFREGGVDVVRIETHAEVEKAGFADFYDLQHLDGDWLIVVFGVAVADVVQREARSPDGNRLRRHLDAARAGLEHREYGLALCR